MSTVANGPSTTSDRRLRYTAAVRDLAILAGLFLLIVVAWLPGILRGEVVTVADDLPRLGGATGIEPLEPEGSD